MYKNEHIFMMVLPMTDDQNDERFLAPRQHHDCFLHRKNSIYIAIFDTLFVSIYLNGVITIINIVHRFSLKLSSSSLF